MTTYLDSARKISISNTQGGAKSPFIPFDKSSPRPTVKMYVCGLTPQDHSHLGHALTAVRFDIIRRYMIHRGLNVIHVTNVTDIDDKIIDRAARTGEDPREFTQRFIQEYFDGLAKMNVLPISKLPKVTEHLPEIIKFIEKLIKKGFAYATSDGSVYFDVAKKEDYGKLSNQNTKMLYESVRKELDKQKHSPLDFALWKKDEASSLSVDSPWGKGRPGWHIECSVMIESVLGSPIDIHGGGLDLKFPHHENEIAQSEAYLGGTFTNFWMHSGLMQVDSQKMSKSLGNFLKLTDAIEIYGPEVLRFVIAKTHYRSMVDLTGKLFGDNLNNLLQFYRLFAIDNLDQGDGSAPVSALIDKFEAAMDNDFNSPEAMVVLEQQRNALLEAHNNGKVFPGGRAIVEKLKELGGVLGLFTRNLVDVETEVLKVAAYIRKTTALTREDVAKLILERAESRKSRNFARADEIRAELTAKGVEILDAKTGTTWIV